MSNRPTCHSPKCSTLQCKIHPCPRREGARTTGQPPSKRARFSAHALPQVTAYFDDRKSGLLEVIGVSYDGAVQPHLVRKHPEAAGKISIIVSGIVTVICTSENASELRPGDLIYVDGFTKGLEDQWPEFQVRFGLPLPTPHMLIPLL